MLKKKAFLKKANKLFLFGQIMMLSFNLEAIPIKFKLLFSSGYYIDSASFHDQALPEYWAPKKLADFIDEDTKFSLKKADFKRIFSADTYSKHTSHFLAEAISFSAQIRFDNMILGVNGGFLYSHTKPALRKNFNYIEPKKKIAILEKAEKERHDLHHSEKDDPSIKSDYEFLDKANDSLKDALKKQKSEADDEKPEALRKNFPKESYIQQQSGGILFIGPYFGYRVNNALSSHFLLHLTLKKSSYKVFDSSENNALQEDASINWSLGLSPGIRFAYNLNDNFQIFLQYSAFFFFDSLTNKIESLEKKASAPQGAPQKNANNQAVQIKELPIIAKNELKQFISIGFIMRLN